MKFLVILFLSIISAPTFAISVGDEASGGCGTTVKVLEILPGGEKARFGLYSNNQQVSTYTGKCSTFEEMRKRFKSEIESQPEQVQTADVEPFTAGQ